MITQLQIKNFKALKDVNLKFDRLNLVIGPNASGKTTLLKACELVTLVPTTALAAEIDSWPNDERVSTSGAESAVQISADFLNIQLSIWFNDLNRQQRRADWGWLQTRAQGFGGVIDYGGQVRLPDGQFHHTPTGAPRVIGLVEQYRPKAQLLRFDPEVLRSPAKNDTANPTVASDGTGLAAVLADIAASDSETFATVQSALRSVIKSFTRLSVPKAEFDNTTYRKIKISSVDEPTFVRDTGKAVGYKLRFGFGDQPLISASSVSEGTLLSLALVTVMAQRNPPNLILVDELERGLHPRALADLVTQLRRLLEIYPELQIIATTHSPYLADCFKAEEIILTALHPDGHSVVGHLSEHPEYDRWKDEMAPGEFWTSVGEQWLVDDKPGTSA